MSTSGTRLAAISASERNGIAAVMVVGALLRLDRIATRSLWQDEAYSLDVARRGFTEMLVFLQTHDAHPVGYYALLAGWIRIVGEHLGWMRVPSAVFGMLAVILTWQVGRRLISPWSGVAAAALVAANPFQVYASNELRMYMPLEAVGLAATWLLWRARGTTGYGWWIAYGVSIATAAYLSYYAALLVVAHAVWLVATGALRRHARAIVVAALSALAVYGPWLPRLAQPAALLRGGLLGLRGQGLWPTYLPEVAAAQSFGGYLFGAVSYHTFRGLPLLAYVPLLLPFAALFVLGYRAMGKHGNARGLIICCWAIPIGLVVVVSLLSDHVIAYAFHLNPLQPYLALVLGAGLTSLRSPWRAISHRTVLGVAATVVAAFVVPAVGNLRGNPRYEAYQYDRAAGMVQRAYAPGDVLVYVPRGVRRGFSFYFTPPGREIGIDVEATRWTRDAVTAEIERALETLSPKDARVWIVISEPVPPGAGPRLIGGLARRGYRQAAVGDFRGLFVLLFARTPEP